MEFLRFNQDLNLSQSWFNRLKNAQQSIEKQLRSYFDPLPGFKIRWVRSQGSKKLTPLIRKKSGTVASDYGVYFYPKPKISAVKIINMVYEALYWGGVV
ncbi:MAG: hypothetical protein KKG00_04410 [Bacteroidetes bacterium]|nr:hypothetical protein [Bacteroidota bacterium]